MKKAILISFIFLLFLLACGKKEQDKQEIQKVTTQATETTAQVVSSVDNDIGNLDELTNELDTSELDNLDAELGELDNLV